MQFQNEGVQFVLGQQPMLIVVRAVDGPFAGQLLNLATTQDAVLAREGPDVTTWGDAGVLAEAQALLVAKGLTDPIVVPSA